MKATIYNDTHYEISWTLDDPITPELVEKIEEAGIELDIDWTRNQFYKAIQFLLDNLPAEEIEERLWDEDPDLLELVELAMQHPLDDPRNTLEDFVRLYIPVMLIILKEITK